ncbi:hypothetical protein VDGD_21649 [Verticillium dahliae]|nr:hypothetical protein VDGD_21649 [Verticillium dahliae]
MTIYGLLASRNKDHDAAFAYLLSRHVSGAQVAAFSKSFEDVLKVIATVARFLVIIVQECVAFEKLEG